MIVLGVAGCHQQQSAAGQDSAQTDLTIVEQFPVDAQGAQIKPPDTTAAADPAGDGKATCGPVKIAMMGALTGPDAALGINIVNGAQMAVDKHNAANPGCQVTLERFDTEGDPNKAGAVAPRIVDSPEIIGLIGPGFSGETNSTGSVFNDAGLAATTASATRVDLSKNGWHTFFRGLGNDASQGQAVANYLKNTAADKKVCVVDDQTDYGTGLAGVVRETLGPVADASCNISVKKEDKDLLAAVTQIKGANPDAIFYSGYYSQAAPFAQQLRDNGVTATFVSADGTKDPEFVKQAGEAAKDAVLSCPCSPAPADFAAEYKEKFKQDPGTYSTEGYDLATIQLKAIDSGVKDRPAMLEFVKKYDAPGVARTYHWDNTGELTNTTIWIYKVQ